MTRYTNSDVQEVVLQFKPDAAPYVATKPCTFTKQFMNSEGLEVRIKVIPNYELENVILGFGDKVEVKAPQSLRDIIKNRLEVASKSYG